MKASPKTVALGFLAVAVVVAGALYLGAVLWNGDTVDTDAGRQFAETNCARCHAIGATGESPLAAAPPFRTFGQRWPLQSLEEALAEGIFTGHPAMPEFQLTPRQIGDFIAYLETVQQQ